MKSPKIGDLAPQFELENQKGQKISLADFQGKKNVALYFYPQAMTPNCTVQACQIRDSKQDFALHETVVLGISPDPPAQLVKFTAKKNLNFDLLSDQNYEVVQKYAAWKCKTFLGIGFSRILRKVFIVGKDGRIKHIIHKVKVKTYHHDILDFVKKNLSE